MAAVSSLVSVVLPFYHGEKFVAKAIDSVLEQTYSPIELMVVSDGSSKQSLAVLDEYRDHLTLVSQANAGVAAARNRGIAGTAGEFVAFLDQDDWWHPEKIARQIGVFEQTPPVGLVHTGVVHIDSDSGTEVGPLDPTAKPHEMIGDCSRKLLLGNPIYNSSVMVRRTVLDDVGHCDTRLAGNTVADYDLWLRIAKRYQFAFIGEPLTFYRMHPQQGMLDRRAMLTAELGVLLNFQDKASWLRDRECRVRLAALYDSLAVAWYDSGNPQKARSYFADALRIARSQRSFVRWAASFLPMFMVDRLRHVEPLEDAIVHD